MANHPRLVPEACTHPHRAALESVRNELKTRFIERSEIIDGLLIALLCEQHALLIGPPGSAKSQVVDTLVASIDGATRFSWLLTKFTTPEEIFGPVSLTGLQQDRFERVTTGRLPEAHVAFVDEVFKGSSAILNSLLGIANERIFHNGGQPVRCPLMTMVGASNELPESADLEALFDRFLLRFEVKYIIDQRSLRFMISAKPSASSAKIDLADLEKCQREVDDVVVPDGIVDGVLTIKQMAEEEGFLCSDRRWRQGLEAIKARAYLDGRDAVEEDDLEIIADILWRHPKDRPAIAGVIGRVGNPLGVRALEILDAAREAVLSVGTVDAADASKKADWVKAASLAESRLTDMDRELDDLCTKNSQRNLRRVHEARSAVKSMRTDLTRRVAELYRI